MDKFSNKTGTVDETGLFGLLLVDDNVSGVKTYQFIGINQK